MTYNAFLDSALQKASDVARASFGTVRGVSKGTDNNQVQTKTDNEIGTLLIDHIAKEFPNYNVIDEERGVIDKNSEYTWVIDPIDGTSNFANGILLYGIMVGLLKGGIPIAGGIALPAFHEVWIAEQGKGTRCNNEKVSMPQQSKLLSSLLAYGIDGHQEAPEKTRKECALLAEIVLHIRNLRITNCTPLDAAWVCQGKYAASLNQTSKIWDNVAQQIIIEEAGGVCTDFWGEPIDYTNPLLLSEKNFTYCVASPGIHKELQTLIHS